MDKEDCSIYGRDYACSKEYATWAKYQCPSYCGLCSGNYTHLWFCAVTYEKLRSGEISATKHSLLLEQRVCSLWFKIAPAISFTLILMTSNSNVIKYLIVSNNICLHTLYFICFYTLLLDSGGVLWFHLGRPCVRLFVRLPSVRIFVSGW